jgi:hypothetical protein
MDLSAQNPKLPLRKALNVWDPCKSQELQEACLKEPEEPMNNEKELININAHVCRYWHKSVSLVKKKSQPSFGTQESQNWYTGSKKQYIYLLMARSLLKGTRLSQNSM